MLFGALIMSAMFLAAVNAVARIPKWGVPLAFVGSGVAAMLALCMGSIVLLAIASLVCVTGAFCVRAGPRAYLWASLAATIAGFGILSYFANKDVEEWRALREKFPLESMAVRLAYEDRARTGHDRPPMETAASLESLEEEITRAGHNYHRERRTLSLERMHASYVKQFIGSEGFGIGRMIWQPRRSSLELSTGDAGPIPLPASRDLMYPPKIEYGVVAEAPKSVTKELQVMHEDGVVDFVHVNGFGYVRDRDHVAGFESHQFSRMPEVREKWSVANLELVSLLKHEEPVAYVSDSLPRMDKLRDVLVRPLDEFEANALKKLEGGKDVEVEYTADRIRMVGSIRALKQCVKCHHAERGELLGAFTYKLKREAAK